MTDTPPTLIRGEWNRSVQFGMMFLWLLLAAAALVLGFLADKGEMLPVAVGVAVVFLVLAYTSYRSHAKQRTWLRTTETGFLLKKGDEETEHADVDLLALSAVVKERHSNGKFVGYIHKGELVVAAGEEIRRVPFDYAFKAAPGDRLAPWFYRNLLRLTENAKANLEQGRPLPGVGWRLTGDGLHVDGKPEEAFLAWNDIAAFYVVDDAVRVWRTGEEVESLSVPTKSMNANLLIGVLEYRLAEKKDAATPIAGDGTGIGRRIFERKATIGVVGGTILGLSLVLAGIFGVIGIGALANREWVGAAICFLLTALSIWGVVIGARFGNRKLVVHERGVKIVRRKREEVLRFDQIGRLGWALTAFYHNGAYTGSALHAAFEPLPGTGLKTMKFGYSFRKSDPQMDSFRDGVAMHIGSRMFAEVKAGKSVPWCAGVVFHPEGVFCPKIPTGFMKKTSGTIPYSELVNHGWGTGTYGLFVEGKKKAVVDLATSKMNFFPGYYCAHLLLGGASTAVTDEVEVLPD